MKQIAINNYLIQELPEGADNVYVNGYADHLCYEELWQPTPTCALLPSGQFELIARCSEASEDIWAEVVDKDGGYYEHRAYGRPLIFDLATECTLSFLQSHNLTPQYIEYIKAEKWDGALPTYSGGGAGLMFNVK